MIPKDDYLPLQKFWAQKALDHLRSFSCAIVTLIDGTDNHSLCKELSEMNNTIMNTAISLHNMSDKVNIASKNATDNMIASLKRDARDQANIIEQLQHTIYRMKRD